MTVEGLTAGYGAAPVLREVSLTVPAGRIVAVLGAGRVAASARTAPSRSTTVSSPTSRA